MAAKHNGSETERGKVFASGVHKACRTAADIAVHFAGHKANEYSSSVAVHSSAEGAPNMGT
jgi:hypothetical protein